MKRQVTGEAGSLRNKVLLSYPDWDSQEGDGIAECAAIMIIGDLPSTVSGVMMNALCSEESSRKFANSLGLHEWKGRVHCGGSLRDENIRIFHEAEYVLRGTMAINDRVSVTSSRGILKAIIEGAGPEKMALVYGFQQWTPTNLWNEIEDGKWIVADYQDSMFFPQEGTPREMWTKAYSAHFEAAADGVIDRAQREFSRRIAAEA